MTFGQHFLILLHALPLWNVYQWNNFLWLVYQKGNIFNQFLSNFQLFGNVLKKKAKDFDQRHKLSEKYPNLEFSWSVCPRIRTDYRDLQIKSPYSSQMREKNWPEKLWIRTIFTEWHPGLTQISKKEHFIANTARVLDATLFVRKNIDETHIFHIELTNSYCELVWGYIRVVFRIL